MSERLQRKAGLMLVATDDRIRAMLRDLADVSHTPAGTPLPATGQPIMGEVLHACQTAGVQAAIERYGKDIVNQLIYCGVEVLGLMKTRYMLAELVADGEQAADDNG